MSSLGEAQGVEDAAGVAVLAGALEEALQPNKGALLRLAAGLLEVLPPLDLHEVEREDLDRDQRVCGRQRQGVSGFQYGAAGMVAVLTLWTAGFVACRAASHQSKKVCKSGLVRECSLKGMGEDSCAYLPASYHAGRLSTPNFFRTCRAWRSIIGCRRTALAAHGPPVTRL